MALLIDQATVRRLLPMAEAIEAMASAFRALGEGRAVLPLRSILWTPERNGAIGMMPGYLPDRLGAKLVTVFPGNHGTELDSHQGVVLLFEARRGSLLAILDATEITAIRGLSTISSSARPGSDEPWCATLRTSTCRSGSERVTSDSESPVRSRSMAP